jgi:hypothetical protein
MRINYRARKSEVVVSDYVIYPANPFIRRDGAQYIRLNIAQNEKQKEMILCHELAHVLLCRQDNGDLDGLPVIRAEVMAWRLARSFCKPQYWDDSKVIENIVTYIQDEDNWP